MLVIKLIFVLLFLNLTVSRGSQETTTIIVETTTEYRVIITDIPELDIQEALNLDVGNYTTMVYGYINAQYSNLKKEERCYDDYTKCLISQGPKMPVCAYNNEKDMEGRNINFKSYCDVYFDNCLRGFRYWRIVQYRFCPWW